MTTPLFSPASLPPTLSTALVLLATALLVPAPLAPTLQASSGSSKTRGFARGTFLSALTITSAKQSGARHSNVYSLTLQTQALTETPFPYLMMLD